MHNCFFIQLLKPEKVAEGRQIVGLRNTLGIEWIGHMM